MNSNIKRFLAYFAYVLLIAYVLIRADELFNQRMLSGTYNPIQSWSILLFPVAVGLLLALPRLISASRQSGSWTYDWVLFLAVGLPALGVQILACFSLLPILNSSPVTGNIAFYHGNLVSISGLVLGYVLLAAFKKAYSWF